MNKIHNRIGFHFGSQSNATGWGDYVRTLDAAGIPAVLMSTGGEGFGDIQGVWDAGSLVPHIAVIRCLTHNDVPLYGIDIDVAVEDWLNRYVPRIGSDVDKYHERVITKHGNELDKNQIEWLAAFYTALHPALLERMGWQNHRICVFSFASGEPEQTDWEKILPFLRLCGENPDKFVIGLHEYSGSTTDIFNEYDWRVGRFQHLYEVCDTNDITRPVICSHEFGWRDTAIPNSTENAVRDVNEAMIMYARHAGDKWLGGGIWTLQAWQGSGIKNQVQKLIVPITELSLSTMYDAPEIPDIPPIDPETLLLSFEDGWVDDPLQPDRRQIPNGFELNVISPGGKLWYGDKQATGTVEALHKECWRLPPQQCQGGSDPLILDGNTAYKMQAVGMLSGTELVYRHNTDRNVDVVIPINTHYHDPDNYNRVPSLSSDDVFAVLLVNDVEVDRKQFPELSDRTWEYLVGREVSPVDGMVEIKLRFQTTYTNSRDLFTDAWVIEEKNVEIPPAEKHKVVIVKIQQESTYPVWLESAGYAFDNYLRSQTASTDDMMTMLRAGNAQSYAVIIDPWLDSQQEAIETLSAEGFSWIRLELGEPPISGEFKFTHWPTNHKTVTQRFGANKFLYVPLGVPSHDGTDVRAYTGDPIYAVADGFISDRHETETSHSYGIFIRVQHDDGYETTYAHCERLADLPVGTLVSGGQLIAYADNTGNSFGSHLHLTLKHSSGNFVDKCGDVWPYNIIDSDIYLKQFDGVTWPPEVECESPVETIDIASYQIAEPEAFRVVKHVSSSGHESNEDVQDMRLDANTMVMRKNQNGEWYRFEDGYRLRLLDTSPGTDSQGTARVYRMTQSGAVGGRVNPYTIEAGKQWVDRDTHRVQFYAKDDCRTLDENSGDVLSFCEARVEKNALFNTYGQNLLFDEVLYLKTNNGEEQLYGIYQGKKAGWIGWQSGFGEAEIVEIHFDRGVMTKEPERYCSW